MKAFAIAVACSMAACSSSAGIQPVKSQYITICVVPTHVPSNDFEFQVFGELVDGKIVYGASPCNRAMVRFGN